MLGYSFIESPIVAGSGTVDRFATREVASATRIRVLPILVFSTSTMREWVSPSLSTDGYINLRPV